MSRFHCDDADVYEEYWVLVGEAPLGGSVRGSGLHWAPYVTQTLQKPQSTFPRANDTALCVDSCVRLWTAAGSCVRPLVAAWI